MTQVNLGTRTANLRAAYSDLKDGYTIIVWKLKMWIYTCKRCGPSYGKDYIACDHYGGQWAIGVNFKDFTDQMRKFGEGKLAYNKEW